MFYPYFFFFLSLILSICIIASITYYLNRKTRKRCHKSLSFLPFSNTFSRYSIIFSYFFPFLPCISCKRCHPLFYKNKSHFYTYKKRSETILASLRFYPLPARRLPPLKWEMNCVCYLLDIVL